MWAADPRANGALGVFGLLITFVGFGFTIIAVYKSRSAAEAAEAAANSMREHIGRFNTATECASVLQTLEEIERLHRTGPLVLLPDRYAAARRSLVQIHHATSYLNDQRRSRLQSAITNIATMKAGVEKHLAAEVEGVAQVSFDIAKHNKIVAGQITELLRLLIELRDSK